MVFGLNKEGHVIITGYDCISELDSDGVATIAKDGREGRVDSECQVLKTNTEKISDSLYKINKLGKWGAESNDGTIVVPCEYDDLGSFNNGVIGLNGVHFTQLETNLNADCPVRVKSFYEPSPATENGEKRIKAYGDDSHVFLSCEQGKELAVS